MRGPPLPWPALDPGPTGDAEVVLTRRTYGTLELFLFSAAGWHPHRIHFDQQYATAVEGYDAVVVHGPLQAVHAVDALVDALDIPVTVRSLTYRHLALLTVGQEAVVKACTRSVGEDGRSATFEVWIERAADGECTTKVVATVESAEAVRAPRAGGTAT